MLLHRQLLVDLTHHLHQPLQVVEIQHLHLHLQHLQHLLRQLYQVHQNLVVVVEMLHRKKIQHQLNLRLQMVDQTNLLREI